MKNDSKVQKLYAGRAAIYERLFVNFIGWGRELGRFFGKDYALVISSTMLEYLPKDKVIFALTNLRQLLKTGGILLIFVTKRNWITHWLAEKWWKTNLFDAQEFRACLNKGGFNKTEFLSLSPGWSGSILVLQAEK